MGAGFPAPWPGDRCETVPGPVKALFELPGADGAPRHDFFRLPFPNDVRRDPSTGRLNLTGFPHPGNALLGFDLVDRYARALERSTDGFGTQTFVTFRFSGRVNFATLRLNDTIRMVDLTTGEGTPALRFSATTDRNAYLCPNPVFVDTGVPLEPGHTYAAWLTTGVQVDGGGAAVARDEDFNAVLAMEPPADPVRARAHAAYAPFRRYLQARMIDPATVLVAAVFTTQRPRAQVPALREAVRALPPGMAPEFVRCDVGVRSPCDDGLTGSAHVRGCVGAPDPRFHEYQGLVEFPVFQRGTRPYRTPGEGELALDAMGRAMPQGTERVCVTVTLPRDTPAPMDGFPAVLYAHGTGGSTRSAVAEGLAGAFARVDLGGGRAGAFATVTWDGVMHGPRRGMGVTDSPDVLFFNFANPEAARDNILQGAADLFAMVRALPTLRLPSPTGMGTVSLDRRRAVFLGHSQGGTVGLPAAAFEPDLAALVFSGTGGDLRASLTTKRRPIDIASLVPVVLQDRGVGINHPALNLFQAYFERSDAANYARAILAERPMGVPLRPVVQVYGLGDTYSTVETMQAVAVSLGIPAAGPIPGGMRAFPSGMGLPFPVMANYADSTGRTTAALLESDPGSAYDGHFVLFRDLALQQRVAVFLATAVEGMAVLR
jgi:hypothetical protein